jgi:hypothetical protein
MLKDSDFERTTKTISANIQYSYSNLNINWRKTDQIGVGKKYEIHDRDDEQNLKVESKILKWLEYK